MHEESRADVPKASDGRHTYAFAEYPGGLPVLVVAETAVAAPSDDLVVPSAVQTVLHFVSGPGWSGSQTRPFTLAGEIGLLEGGRGGLVVLTLRGTVGGFVVRLRDGDSNVDFDGGCVPTGVVQLIRDDGGHRIDAIAAEPPPGSLTNRYYVVSGEAGGFRPAPAGVEAAVVSRVAGSLAASAAEVFQVPGSARSFISLGLGRPLVDYGLPVAAVVWLSPLKVCLVVADDIVPMLVPVCRGSGTFGAAIFPDEAPLMKRLSYEECPVATAGLVVLCRGRAYMVVQ